ncbi:hypothetical protein V2S66_04440 [Streptomyces sp. V4-01]|uniref:Uncharacterized protein n=1 Tax=Actinacidiphila polyblastidii TaxID=3110430 RepID=A0ABU7P5X5_9ACTN|nr:hypothetical protein [Streptomyces sp. V4-01]
MTVKSVDHLGFGYPPRHLIGRSAVVADHRYGMKLLADLTGVERLTGYYLFTDTDVTVTGKGTAPDVLPSYRVNGYQTPQNGGAR